jgi:hydrogenase maturation factor
MSDEPGKLAGTSANDTPKLTLVGSSADMGGASPRPYCVLDAEGHCITCSDEAQVALVLHVDEETGLAQVDIEGTIQEVDVTLVDGAQPGSWLLVPGGAAIGTIDSVERLVSNE